MKPGCDEETVYAPLSQSYAEASKAFSARSEIAPYQILFASYDRDGSRWAGSIRVFLSCDSGETFGQISDTPARNCFKSLLYKFIIFGGDFADLGE